MPLEFLEAPKAILPGIPVKQHKLYPWIRIDTEKDILRAVLSKKPNVL